MSASIMLNAEQMILQLLYQHLRAFCIPLLLGVARKRRKSQNTGPKYPLLLLCVCVSKEPNLVTYCDLNAFVF